MKKILPLLTVCMVTLMLVSLEAAEKREPATPGIRDPDFKVQGEYVGILKKKKGDAKYGIQVIARGEGKFHLVSYSGGLPGAGADGEEKVEADGTTKEKVTTFPSKYGTATINNGDGIMHITNKDGVEISQFKKVDRTSPTSGQKPPKGATVLFEGTSVEGWKGGRLTEDGFLREGTTSKELVGDCTLHLEFRLSFQPKASGQGRSNSGCYLQGRYEVQVLDSFGLEGKNNECGGLYSIKAPDVNMCLPPMTWQTYDIDFKAAKYDASGKKTANARITVKHNGVLIHKDVELPKSTTAAPVKEGADDGPIYLQNHGNTLWYRNIWVVKK